MGQAARAPDAASPEAEWLHGPALPERILHRSLRCFGALGPIETCIAAYTAQKKVHGGFSEVSSIPGPWRAAHSNALIAVTRASGMWIKCWAFHMGVLKLASSWELLVMSGMNAREPMANCLASTAESFAKR